MPTTSVNIGFRPPRIAALVRAGLLSDVAEAAVANTHLWGGRYNPIIPVAEDADAALGEVQLFRPDLVTVIGKPSETQSAVLEAMQHLKGPPLLDDPFDQMEGGSMGYADIRLICRHHYNTTFRFGVSQSRAVTVQWPETDESDAYLAVMLGRYRADAPGESFRRAFTAGLSATTLGLDQLAKAAGAMTPIDLTGSELHASAGSAAAGVVVGESSSPSALVTYWNLRSVGCDVVFWPTDKDEARTAYAVESLQQAQARWAQGRLPSYIDLWIDSDDGPSPDPPQDLVERLEQRETKWARGVGYGALWRQPTSCPCVWAVPHRAVLASLESRPDGGMELVASLPPHPFSAAEPKGLGRPQWLVTVSTYRQDLEGYTFNIPPVATLTPWASTVMRVFGDVRLESRGVAAFEEVAATSVTVRLVPERAVIQRLFKEVGLEAKISPAGEAADRIIKQMGGLWGARKLRLHGLRALLASGSRAWSWQNALRQLHHQGSYLRYRNVPQPAELLRSLIARGVFQAVFELRCPSCAVRSDYRLDELGERINCPRCSQEFDSAPLLESGRWGYRPSGFFATLLSHGSLPVVLTMIRMLETLHMDQLTIDASHHISSEGWSEECDFVALWRDRDGDPVMAIGECKGGKQLFQQSDQDGLRRIAERIRGLGVECYLVMATTRPEFTEEERVMFASLRDELAQDVSLDGDYQGRRLGPVLLTADQLDFHEFAALSVRDELPERHLGGIGELARNSLAINLDPVLSQRVREAREPQDFLI